MYMVILPAIDLHEGQCVRLHQGEFSTAEKVAEDALETAKGFEEKGARWPPSSLLCWRLFQPHILLRRAGILLHVLDFEHVQAL